MEYVKKEFFELNQNLLERLKSDSALITAGTKDDFNTMTIGWGGFGYIWSRPVMITVVRPTRYTYEFCERSDKAAVSFFGENMKNALALCGKLSGRDTDKVAEAGLTPMFFDEYVSFQEAEIVVTGKKLFSAPLDPEALAPEIFDIYKQNDFHKVYYYEIVGIYGK